MHLACSAPALRGAAGRAPAARQRCAATSGSAFLPACSSAAAGFGGGVSPLRGAVKLSSRRGSARIATRAAAEAEPPATPVAPATPVVALLPEPKTPLTRVKSFFGGAKLDRAKLAALGASALLAYGFISNVNAVTLLIVSWVSFAKSTGLSPLAPGQWKAYLLTYTALYAVIGNALRPVRFSISVAITPLFDRFVAFLQRRLGVTKPVAFGTCVFLVNVCGTCTYLALGLRIVTAVLGLPLLPN